MVIRPKGISDMGRAGVLALAVVLVAGSAFGQFKSQVEEQARVNDAMIHESSSFLFGWFNPDRFHMNHSLSFSYQSFNGQGISLGTYTNSMRYDIADNFNAQADVSLSYSPYNSIPAFGKNDFSNIYLSRAELNYRPWENTMISVQYRNSPYGFYDPYYFNPWYRGLGY
jgi:hypothetical protein